MQPVAPLRRINQYDPELLAFRVVDVVFLRGLVRHELWPSSRGKTTAGKSKLLVDRLQLLARFEAYGLARRNADLSAGARVAPDARLPRPHVEYAEAAQFNALALGQRLLHALKHRLHGRFRLGLGDA